MDSLIEKVKKINNRIAYILPVLAILSIIVFPFLTKFVNFIPEWQENNFMVLFWLTFIFIMNIVFIIGLFILILNFNKPIKEKDKIGKLKGMSNKKIKILNIIFGLIIIFMVFGYLRFNLINDIEYTKKSINYIYIQHKEPITFIDTVVKEDSGGVAVKFVHYATFQNQKSEDRYTHMFSAVRFKVGKKYEIKIIPGTKYILERKLVE